MSAVRKLLLADDSITIQKIVALTFADAGIEVIAVNNGTDAVEKLWENAPDVVLADVFMPGLSGYEVCERVKTTESLKHIPVMLLVGSFEPFDEAEARRVGADDILTKPFQSIRTLMDKVLGRTASPGQPQPAPPAAAAEAPVPEPVFYEAPVVPPPSADVQAAGMVDQEADTKDLPSPEVIDLSEEPMTAEELEITTADTQPLSPQIKKAFEHAQAARAQQTHAAVFETTMPTTPTPDTRFESAEGFGDALLDLGNPEPVIFVNDDDAVLEIDFDSAPQPYAAPASAPAEVAMSATAEPSAYASAYATPVVAESFGHSFQQHEATYVPAVSEPELVAAPEAAAQFVGAEAMSGAVAETESTPVSEVHPPVMGSQSFSGQVTLDQLSPEVIDAIARRVVEQMSEKAVQEIAWEVVPQLADLMIKRKLEEHEAQSR